MQFIEGHRVHLDAEVDAVQQRAGHPAAVLPHRAGRTGAGPGGVAVVAAFAGVHGGDELEAAGISGASGGRLTVMQPSSRGWRSTSRLSRENSGSSSRKRTPQLARLHSPGRNCAPPPASAAELAEWWGLRKGRAVTRPRPAGICRRWSKFLSSPRLLPGQGRQDAGQAAGQHGFAGAGRTDEQDVVSARSRDDHRPAGQRLAADVSEIGNLAPRIGRVEGDRHRRQDGLDAPQCIHDLTGRCAG